MLDGRTPRWLTVLEKKMGWLAIPNIGSILVVLQALGFFMVASNALWYTRLALYPEAVLAGEYWRLVTFLSLPLSMSPLWVIFVLWFLYFIMGMIEEEWGSFKATFYVLISVVLTILFSFAFDYPVTHVSLFESSLFLAAAALHPNFEVRLFLVFPVKMKWLAWLTLAFIAVQFFQGFWIDRFYILVIFSNYLLFFGPAHINQIRLYRRRARFKKGDGI